MSMIFVRPYGNPDGKKATTEQVDKDFAQLNALHALRQSPYELPNLESEEMLIKSVMEENGKITNAILIRRTAELYWIFDPAMRKRELIARMNIFGKTLIPEARKIGLEDVHGWIPTESVGLRFDKMLRDRFNWQRPLWTCYKLDVKGGQ